MAKLQLLSDNSWRQLFIDRYKTFNIWSTHYKLTRNKGLKDGDKINIKIKFENRLKLKPIQGEVVLTSGWEFKISHLIDPAELKRIVYKNRDSHFDVEIF